MREAVFSKLRASRSNASRSSLINSDSRKLRNRRLLFRSEKSSITTSKAKVEGHSSWPLQDDPRKAIDDLGCILSEISDLNIGEFIVEKQEHATNLGASCDVLSAWSLKHGTKVAVKRIRAFLLEDEKFAKRLAREIRIWASLNHENVLPLLGYFLEGKRKLPNLVSRWMVNGSLFDYKRNFPRCSFQACRMLHGIASGLTYLHCREVVHADLKSASKQTVLIDSDGTPLLADFGLSLTLTESQPLTTASSRGTLRWMAPELLPSLSGEKPSRPSKSSDIWAFGMLAYELLSWKFPYHEKRDDYLVMLAIMNGELPIEVEMDECCHPYVFHSIWTCCKACWANSITARPTALGLGHFWLMASSREMDRKALVDARPQALPNVSREPNPVSFIPTNSSPNPGSGPMFVDQSMSTDSILPSLPLHPSSTTTSRSGSPMSIVGPSPKSPGSQGPQTRNSPNTSPNHTSSMSVDSVVSCAFRTPVSSIQPSPMSDIRPYVSSVPRETGDWKDPTRLLYNDLTASVATIMTNVVMSTKSPPSQTDSPNRCRPAGNSQNSSPMAVDH